MSITKISPSVVDFDAGITISTADNLDTLTLTSTDADANAGPNLRLYRNSGSPADSDALGLIEFEGRNDNTQDVVYAGIDSRIIDASDSSEDGRLEIVTMLAGTAGTSRILMDATETVFNDNSANLDFRVESDDHTHMLFVDAENNAVGIKNDSPHDTSWAADGANSAQLSIGNTSSGSSYGVLNLLGHNGQATKYSIGAGDGIMYLAYDDVNSAHRLKVHSDGDFEVVDGDIRMASGHGIDFSATGTGTGTPSSHLLSDYEHGSFTIGLSGVTIAAGNTTAYYVKVGQMVWWYWYSGGLTLNSAVANSAKLTGLPFTANSTGYTMFHYVHGNAVSGDSRGGYVDVGNTTAPFIVDGGTNIATFNNGSGKYIMVQGMLTTDS